NFICTDISDDGTYLILAITNNQLADTTNPIADTRIIFWDGGNTTTWLREHSIPDPFIFKRLKTPFGSYAYGVTGIWQISIGGVKKIYDRATGIYSVNH